MKFGAFLFALSISTAANAESLTCKPGEVCFDKSVSATENKFSIEPGSDVKIEVTVVNGATVSFMTDGAQSQASEVQLAPEPVTKTITMNAPVGESGTFTLVVQPAKISFEGEVSDTAESYNLKISRVKHEVQGESL